jgi:predicted aldo/keto reductase-like oxidoreductase
MTETLQGPVVLGRSGLTAGRLGVAASYGVPAASVEKAFERGLNYLYWGSIRRGEFGKALRNLARRHRERMIVVFQSYVPLPFGIAYSVERGLRSAGFDYVDVLLLGLWNRPVPESVLEICRRLKERGAIRKVAVSTHNRPMLGTFIKTGEIDIVHIRYNSVHTGAERDAFPLLENAPVRPGIVSFTATSWGQLVKSPKIPANEKRPSASDCYRFVLSHPAVNVCLTGPSNAAELDAALEALDRGPMDASELAWMRRVGDAIYGKSRR